MIRWTSALAPDQVVYFSACEIIYRTLLSAGVPLAPIGDHFQILAGYAFKSQDFVSDGIPLLRNINVKPDRIDWSETVCLPPDEEPNYTRFRLSESDLVMSMDGPITKQGIKIAFLTHHDVPALLLQRVCRFDPVGSVEKRFLYHILHSEDFLNHLDKSNRSIAIPHVSPGQLKSFQIPVLSSNQQIAICNFLDSVLIGDLSKSWPPLPQSLAEQQHTVAKLGELAIKIKEANKLKIEIDKASHQLLRGVFDQMTKNAKLLSMSEVAPITRRPVKVDLFSEYPELGIRSFGNGTFHKIPLSGAAVGNKRLFRIKPGDLVFNNVFAWEGAVAVAKGEDFGRFGSHRFITCVPQKGLSTPEFLCFYFLTNEGLEKMGQASPGGAGRNRTLGLEALSEIEVPVPPIEHQIWFGLLQAKVESLKKHQDQTLAELDGLMRSILDKAFKGEL